MGETKAPLVICSLSNCLMMLTKDLARMIFFPGNRLRNTALHEATLLGLAGRECISALLRYVPWSLGETSEGDSDPLSDQG